MVRAMVANNRMTIGRAAHWRVGVRWLAVAALLLTWLAACGPADPTPTIVPSPEAEVPDAPTVAPPARVPGQAAGRILFVRGGNLWVWQNNQERQLTEACGCKQPRWSPTGDALLYIKVGDSYSELFWADANGQNARQLTSNRALNLQPETKEYIAASLMISGLSWARTANNTNRIAYSTDRDGGFGLSVATGVDGKPVAVNGTAALGGGSEGAALSPDGNTLAFVHELTDERTGNRATQVFLVNIGSGAYRALTSEANGAYDPAWSPDGQWLTYAARQAKGTETNLYLIRPDGTGKQRLTEGGRDRGAGWSRDGDQIAFARQFDNGFALFMIELSAQGGTISAGKPIRLGNFNDVDPASGVSWAR